MPILILLLMALLAGCTSNEEQKPVVQQGPPLTAQQPQEAPTPSVLIMQQGISPSTFELPSQAPQVWREFAVQKPALILFSENPFLMDVPRELKTSVRELLQTGTEQDFNAHTSILRADPWLLPQQTLSAAIDNQLISEILWYFPSRADLADFKADGFRESMTKAGFLTAEEAAQLNLREEGILEGTVRGIPLRILHPLAALPELEQPALLHIDLGYYRGLFKNSVSTPLYDLLQENAQLLRESQWKILAATLSYSNEGGNYSLPTRFLITDLAELLKTPQLLNGDMPQTWQNRKDALFSQDFYQESKSKELFLKNNTLGMDDASVQFDTYQVQIQSGQNEQAFEQLDRAVALDPGYAEEYLTLIGTGEQKGWVDKTLILYDKAIKALTENPFISLRKADLLLQNGQKEEALKIYQQQMELPWSKIYHPDMPESLKRHIEAVKSGEIKEAPDHQQE